MANATKLNRTIFNRTTTMNTVLSEADANTVYEVLSKELGVDRSRLTPEARIREDFNPDSLTIIEISMALEECLNLSIPDESWERVQTVSELFELVAGLQETSKRR